MKKTLAASFLVTVGIAGCTVQQGPPSNPPPPPPETVEPTPAPPEPTEVDPPDPEPTDGGDQGGNDLPQPGPNDNVVTKKDGTCWVMPDVDCPPPPATCNPPPPMQVSCPEEQ